MRSKTAKQLRKLIGYSVHDENPIMKRTYRRIKKLYNSIPKNKRYAFKNNEQ